MLTVYKASAGSGKTYTLAYEYIKLLLGYKDSNTGEYKLNKKPQKEHQGILAVTFTNKATDEMKRRIIKELAILAELPAMDNEKSPYLKNLYALFKCTPEELKDVAGKVLGQLLFDYTFFNVSTIDSFFQNVLRTFAFEIDLTGDYEVELDDSFAISAGVNELFNVINYHNDKRSNKLSEWLRQYMMYNVESGLAFNVLNRKSNIFAELLKYIGKLSDEQFKLRLTEEVESYFEDSIRIEKFEEQLKKHIAKIKKEIINKTTELKRNIPSKEYDKIKSAVRGQIDKWQAVTKINAIDDLKVSKVVLDVHEGCTSPFVAGKGSQESIDLVCDTINRVLRLLRDLRLDIILLQNIYGMGLIGDTMKFIKEFRDNNNVILLSDTNDLLQRIISEDDAPFIYERMGVRLRHFLIDEFQDTSRLQWTNINPLVSESLSQDNDNLIIGDAKQCIYRFRNSDPSLLQSQVSADFGRHVVERGIHIKENTNWRSSAEVVQFNNTIFSVLAQKYELDDLYSNVTQQVSEKHVDHKGYVKLELIKEGDGKSVSLEKMAADIKRQLDSGYKQKDIAILVRKGSDGELAINYLMGLMALPNTDFPKIEIMSDGALLIDSSPMVRLIISILRLLNNDICDMSKRKSRRRFNKVMHRYVLYLNREYFPNDALQKAIHFDDKEVEELLDVVSTMKCVSLPSLIERIIKHYIPEDLRQRDLVYITAFQDEVLDFCSRGSDDVSSFLRWWDKSSSHYITSSEDIDAIRVMTIHKSKGLEFKCVHIPIANWCITGDPNQINCRWFDLDPIEGIDAAIVPPMFVLPETGSLKETPLGKKYEALVKERIIDSINETYVAFTRAVDELCVNCIVQSRFGENGLARVLFDALPLATPGMCDSLRERHRDANGELFVPLNQIVDDKLEIGNPTIPREEEKKDVPPAERVTTIPPALYYTEDRDDLWALTRLDDADSISPAQERGVFLHKVMEHVYHLSDLQLALKRQGYRNNISDQELDEMYVMLSSALSDERVSQWFEGYRKTVNERSICLKKEAKYTRPDRVVWTAQGTIDVVDYKFGEELEDHKTQVKGYMKHLIDMGYEKVRGFVWYMPIKKIVPVK